MRKTPVSADVDMEYLAERTHGYSGADIAGVAKTATKIAIRYHIKAEVCV